ncbi:hypothetical protein M3610_24725, partial [Neobacillus sp. MER 74]|uniref:hypothetical protein n=1 Tax=Neobacillus sp. MER 74 TaxID=2939566 RepID=UPI0020421337
VNILTKLIYDVTSKELVSFMITRRFAPAGSPLPRTPAGVFVPSAPINRVLKSVLTFNTAF